MESDFAGTALVNGGAQGTAVRAVALGGLRGLELRAQDAFVVQVGVEAACRLGRILAGVGELAGRLLGRGRTFCS